MSTLKVSVTAEDIAAGERRCCGACPIALAVARVTGASFVHTGPVAVQWSLPHGADLIQGELPTVAFEFMMDFDRGMSVAPFDFDLELA